MIYKTYQEFVTYPLFPDKVKSLEDRLDIHKAYRKLNGRYPEEYSPNSEKGAIIEIDTILNEDDSFEAMEITDFGYVTIWTKNKVWFLTRDHGKLERLKYIARNPTG